MIGERKTSLYGVRRASSSIIGPGMRRIMAWRKTLNREDRVAPPRAQITDGPHEGITTDQVSFPPKGAKRVSKIYCQNPLLLGTQGKAAKNVSEPRSAIRKGSVRIARIC